MFTHVMVGSKDPEASRTFYDKVLGALGHEPSKSPPGAKSHFYGNMAKGAAFGVGKPLDGADPTHANGGTISFAATKRAQVDAFHAAGLEAGGTCEGPPGERAPEMGSPYGAYLRDPDGNKLACFTSSKE